MKTVRFAVAFLLCLIATGSGKVAGASGPEAAAVVPADFAYGIPLVVKEDGAIHELPIPVEVYRGVTRGDLGDVCVFNGQGEIVPFSIRMPLVEAVPAPAAVALPIFPVFGTPGQNPQGLSLHMRRDSSGSIIDLRADSNDVDGQDRTVVAYLLECGSLSQPIRALQLEWPTSSEGFMLKVTVERSNDMNRWLPVVKAATIAGLKYGDRTIEQRTIELTPPVRAKYFRLTWPQGKETLHLTGASALPAGKTSEPKRQWTSLDATSDPGKPGEYRFNAPGFMPVDRLMMQFPQKNTLASGTFFSREGDQTPWRVRNPGGEPAVLYHLQVEGVNFFNPAVVVAQGTDRDWMVRFEPPDAVGHGTVKVHLGWAPQHLVFVARGDGPFFLACGSARIPRRSLQANDLLARVPTTSRAGLGVKPASFGTPYLLGGEEMLRPQDPPLPWRQWVLWLVLVAGVGLLGWMTRRLYRQMNARKEPGIDNTPPPSMEDHS